MMQDDAVAILFLVVGLPGAGKTTRSRQLAREHRALRLTPDSWMIPLFGDSDAGGKRDVLEGRLIWLAFEALRLDTSVVLDFGFWGRDERASLSWLARSMGADPQVVYLAVDPATQLVRIQQRWSSSPQETFAVTAAELDLWRRQFEEPDAAELAGHQPPGPPRGWPSWADWAAQRWPSLQE